MTPIMENQREKKMDHEMENGVIWGLYRDPSMQIILHWALKSVTSSYIGLFGTLGMVAGAELLGLRVQGLVFVGLVGFRVWLSLGCRGNSWWHGTATVLLQHGAFLKSSEAAIQSQACKGFA